MINFNLLKENEKGSVVFGPFLKITDPAIIEVAGYAGFDFAIIDLEHGPISIENCQNMIRAAENSGIYPIVRVPANNEKQILRVLDIGARGVEVPDINTKKQAEELVSYAYYSPLGERGVCKFVRAAQYTNIEPDDHFKNSNDNIVTIAHIEGEEGINNLKQILEVKDLDIIFIGPYDLSQSMGIPGRVNDPKVVEKMEEVVANCNKAGKIVGTFVESAAMAEKWVKAGVKYIAFSVDVGMIYEKFSSVVQQCQKIATKKK